MGKKMTDVQRTAFARLHKMVENRKSGGVPQREKAITLLTRLEQRARGLVQRDKVTSQGLAEAKAKRDEAVRYIKREHFSEALRAISEAQEALDAGLKFRRSYTYGVMPPRADFDTAFFQKVTDGRYRVRNHPVLGTETYDNNSLFEALVPLNEHGDGRDVQTVGDVLATLGFEWV